MNGQYEQRMGRIHPGSMMTDTQSRVIVRKVSRGAGERVRMPRQHGITRYALLYVKQGSGEVVIDNQAPQRLQAPQLLLLVPGMLLTEQPDPLVHWDVCYVAFDLVSADAKGPGSWEESLLSATGGLLDTTDRPAIERHFSRLEASDVPQPLRIWNRQIALSELLLLVMEQQLDGERGGETAVIRRCAAHIERHYAQTIRIDHLAESCGLHPSAFSRRFKQEIGMSPSDYIGHIRMEAAKVLLAESIPLREIARRTGFCDEYYFSRMFKKVSGLSPSVYMRTAQTRPATMRTYSRPALQPVNVAVTYIDEADHLIALGLLPSAVPNDRNSAGENTVIPYLRRYIAQLPQIGCEEALDLNLLRRLHPELIIAGKFIREWGVLGLDEIAPTHYYPWEVDWRNLHRQFAGRLGREQTAEHNIAQFDALVRTARERMFHACAHRAFVFLETTREGVRISPYMSNGGWLLYQLIGLNPAPVVSVNNWAHFISVEEAATLTADYVFVGRRSCSDTLYAELSACLSARRDARSIIALPRYPWSKGGPLAYMQGIRQTLALFSKLHK